jgi:hypothetical protein
MASQINKLVRLHFGKKTRGINLFDGHDITTVSQVFRVLDPPELDNLEVYQQITIDNFRAWKFIGWLDDDGQFEPAGITHCAEVVPTSLDPDSSDIHDLSSYLQYSDAEWALVTACVTNKWADVRFILQKWPWYRGTAIIEAVRALRTRLLANILREFPACQTAKYGKIASAGMRHNRALRLAVRRSLTDAVSWLIREPGVNINTHGGQCLITAIENRERYIFYELLSSPQLCPAIRGNEALATAFRMRWDGDSPEMMYRSLLAHPSVQDKGIIYISLYSHLSVQDTLLMQRDMDTVRLHGSRTVLPSLQYDLPDQRMLVSGSDNDDVMSSYDSSSDESNTYDSISTTSSSRHDNETAGDDAMTVRDDAMTARDDAMTARDDAMTARDDAMTECSDNPSFARSETCSIDDGYPNDMEDENWQDTY